MTKELSRLMATPHMTVKDAWKQLNDNGYKIIFVVDAKQRLIGSLADSDVRRWILADESILAPVEKTMHDDPIVAFQRDSKETIQKKFIEHCIECIPVLDDERTIQDVIFWKDLFHGEYIPVTEKIDVPVVIMAGGKGARLEPFTKILPKPLMPVGDKPIIEIIMEKFHKFGVHEFYLTLNYKANMIRAYFQDGHYPYTINYLCEDAPTGTIGALTLLKDAFHSTFMVSNADIIVDMNYADLLGFHRKHGHKLTVVCSMKQVSIPYGVVDIEKNGALKCIREKPELDYLVITGIYVLEPEIIPLIPPNQEFHMTHLIEKLRREDQKIGVYPVADSLWGDVGEFAAYRKVLEKFS